MRHKNKLPKITCVLRNFPVNMPEVCVLGTSNFMEGLYVGTHEFSLFVKVLYLNRFHKAYIITLNIANILYLPVFRIHALQNALYCIYLY